MPQYLLSAHSVDGEARKPMTDEEMKTAYARIGALEAEMKSAGAWVFGGRLHAPDTATVVRMSDGEVMTTDGPFAESKDLDGALSWASKTADCVSTAIEVRPFVVLPAV
jgi:hypothetical protein